MPFNFNVPVKYLVIIFALIITIFLFGGYLLFTYIKNLDNQSIAPQVQKPAIVTLTDNLLRTQPLLQGAKTGKEKNAIISQQISIASERKSNLTPLIQVNPQAFLRNALPAETRNRFVDKVAAFIEKEVEIEGTLYAGISETFGGSSLESVHSAYTYELVTKNQQAYQLHFSEPVNLKGTTKISVKGYLLDNNIVVYVTPEDKEEFVESTSKNVLAAKTGGGNIKKLSTSSSTIGLSTTGQQNLAMIIIKFKSLPNAELPDKLLVDQHIFTDSTSTYNYFQKNSYGNLTFPSAVFGPVEIDVDISRCDFEWESAWSIAADNALGGQIDTFRRRVYLLPNMPACPLGTGTLRGSTIISPDPTKSFIFNGSVVNKLGDLTFDHAVNHELGHQLGIDHAGTFNCSANPPNNYENCTPVTYSDPTDIMGSRVSDRRHLNSPHKDKLSWIGGQKQTITQDGNFTLYPLEKDLPGGPRLLIVKTPNGREYFLEYRKNLDIFSQLGSPWGDGISIKMKTNFPNEAGGPMDTALIKPNGAFVLTDGASFIDNVNGVTVIQNQAFEDRVTFSVRFGTPVCENANPTISISPLSQVGIVGAASTYTMTIRNNNNSLCPQARFETALVLLPSGISFGGVNQTFDLASGASTSLTLTATPARDINIGTYNFAVEARNTANTAYKARADASIVVDQALSDETVIIPLGITPAAPIAGNLVTFEGTVKNIGFGASLGFTTTIFIDNNVVANVPTGPLAPSATEVETAAWIATEGNHTLKVYADSSNVVNEASETNNYSSITFTSASLPVQSPTASITGPASGGVNQTLTYNASANGTRLTGIEVFVSPTSLQSWTKIGGGTNICNFTTTCSTGASWTPSVSEQYYVVVNAYSDANGDGFADGNLENCSGNPFGLPLGWVDCGVSDSITVSISSTPPLATPTPTPVPLATATPTSTLPTSTPTPTPYPSLTPLPTPACLGTYVGAFCSYSSPCCDPYVCPAGGSSCVLPQSSPTPTPTPTESCKTQGQVCTTSGTTSNCCSGLLCSSGVCTTTTYPTPVTATAYYANGCVFNDIDSDGKFNGVDRSSGTRNFDSCTTLGTLGPEKGIDAISLTLNANCGSIAKTTSADGSFSQQYGSTCLSNLNVLATVPQGASATTPNPRYFTAFIKAAPTATNAVAVADIGLKDVLFPTSTPIPTPTPTPTLPPPQKQLARITVDGIEIYPQNRTGTQINLTQKLFAAVVVTYYVTYVDTTGSTTTISNFNFNIDFLRPPSATPTSSPTPTPTPAANFPPSASISAPSTVAVGQPITFSASASDFDGNLASGEIWLTKSDGTLPKNCPPDITIGGACRIKQAALSGSQQSFTGSWIPSVATTYIAYVKAYDTAGGKCSGASEADAVDCGSSDIVIFTAF